MQIPYLLEQIYNWQKENLILHTKRCQILVDIWMEKTQICEEKTQKLSTTNTPSPWVAVPMLFTFL